MAGTPKKKIVWHQWQKWRGPAWHRNLWIWWAVIYNVSVSIYLFFFVPQWLRSATFTRRRWTFTTRCAPCTSSIGVDCIVYRLTARDSSRFLSSLKDSSNSRSLSYGSTVSITISNRNKQSITFFMCRKKHCSNSISYHVLYFPYHDT